MSDLKDCLLGSELNEVSTYIQSGNLIFRSSIASKEELTNVIASAIKQAFGLEVRVAIFSAEEWHKIIDKAPAWLGQNELRKYNLLILIEPGQEKTIVSKIGPLKSGVEAVELGNGVVYQGIAIAAAKPGVIGSNLTIPTVNRLLTIRNYNTATKLASLLN